MGIQQGDTFGRWTALEQLTAGRRAQWKCQCECGTVATVRWDSLGRQSLSCGCLRRELTSQRMFKHGKPPEYGIWQGMKNRCNNPNAANYYLYGARGIRVCQRWASFPAFFADMGQRPTPKHSIERSNSYGHYEPSNCYWATQTQQIRNRRTTVIVTIDGIALPAAEWYERYQLLALVSYHTFALRLRRGWKAEEALFTPSLR